MADAAGSQDPVIRYRKRIKKERCRAVTPPIDRVPLPFFVMLNQDTQQTHA
jgi:hypothetical protein